MSRVSAEVGILANCVGWIGCCVGGIGCVLRGVWIRNSLVYGILVNCVQLIIGVWCSRADTVLPMIFWQTVSGC